MAARKTAQLTAAGIKAMTAPGDYSDGRGLYLRVEHENAKRWILRKMVGGRAIVRGLGTFPEASLAEARDRAAEMSRLILNGKDPTVEARKAEAEALERARITPPTFRDLALRTIALKAPGWKSRKHADQWRSTLGTYAFPYIGSMPVDQISASDVLGLLEPVWVAKPETASRVRQRVESVMDLAVLSGWRPQMDNPASRALLRVLPAAKRAKEHHTALPYQAVPSALHKVGLSTCYPLTKLAFRLLVLTATRSGEVRGADWSEIDLETRTWVIPSHRMKAGREHRIPLSTQSTDTLRDAWVISGPDGLIFPAPRSGGVLSDMTLTQLLRRLEIPATVHGFRSSFRDWAAEKSGARWAVCESALAHNVGTSTEQAYMRSTFFEQRAELMQEWADYIAG